MLTLHELRDQQRGDRGQDVAAHEVGPASAVGAGGQHVGALPQRMDPAPHDPGRLGPRLGPRKGIGKRRE